MKIYDIPYLPKIVEPLHSFKIHEAFIERVAEFIVLVFTLSEHLNWKSHINKVVVI